MYFKLNLFSYSYNKCFYKKKKEIKLRFDRSIQGRGGLEAKCICKDDGNHSVPGPMNGIRKRQNDVGFLPTTKAQSRVKKKKKNPIASIPCHVVASKPPSIKMINLCLITQSPITSHHKPRHVTHHFPPFDHSPRASCQSIYSAPTP